MLPASVLDVLLLPICSLALTLHATNILNYWVALVVSLFCLPCLICGTTAFSDLNVKLEARETIVVRRASVHGVVRVVST